MSTVFRRAAWQAAPSKDRNPRPLVDVAFGVVHDIGGGPTWPSSVAATLQGIQSMEQHGAYVDIAYNWGVDVDGNRWELRGDVSDGATKGYAGISFSVLAICNAAAPNFTASDAMVNGIAECFLEAQDRGVIRKADVYVDGHHWFDTHETSAPTACPSALMAQIPKIRAAFDAGQFHPAPSGGKLMTTVAFGASSNGRTPTARPIPEFGAVLLENGARVGGDKASGKNFTWIPPGLPAGSKLIDIAAVDGPAPFVALYAFPNGDVGTYQASPIT